MSLPMPNEPRTTISNSNGKASLEITDKTTKDSLVGAYYPQHFLNNPSSAWDDDSRLALPQGSNVLRSFPEPVKPQVYHEHSIACFPVQ